MPFPWISLKRKAQQPTRPPSPPQLCPSLPTQPSSLRTATDHAALTTPDLATSIIQTRGTAAVQAWLDGRAPDALTDLHTEQAGAARHAVQGPQTKGHTEVLHWLQSPGPETLDGVLTARDRARADSLSRRPTTLERPSPALPALRFEPLEAMLEGAGLDLRRGERSEGGAERVSAELPADAGVAYGRGSKGRRVMFVDETVASSPPPSRRPRVGISHLYPELFAPSSSTMSSADSSRSEMAGLYREPIYEFSDDESELGAGDDLYVSVAANVEDASDTDDENGRTSRLANRLDGPQNENDIESDDEEVLPLASGVVQRARKVEMALPAPTLAREDAILGQPKRVPKLTREDATIGHELPVTVGRVSRGRVVDVGSPMVSPDADAGDEAETDAQSSDGEHDQDDRGAGRGRDMAREGSWRSEEEEPTEVTIKVTPASPEPEPTSAWDSSSDESDDDDDGTDAEWCLGGLVPSTEDGVEDTTKPKTLRITVPSRPSRHGRHLEVPIETHGPSRRAAAAAASPASPPIPPSPAAITPESPQRDEDIALLNRTLSLTPSTPFHVLQSHLAANTSLLHALLLGTVPAPHLPEADDPSSSSLQLTIRLPTSRYTAACVPALVAFLSLDWDPAPLGGGVLPLVASSLGGAIARAEDAQRDLRPRDLLEQTAAHLRKTTRAQARREGRLEDGLLARLGRVVALDEVGRCPDLGAVVRAGRADEFVALVEAGRVTRGEGGEMASEGAVLRLMGITAKEGREGPRARVERWKREGPNPSPLRVVEGVEDGGA